MDNQESKREMEPATQESKANVKNEPVIPKQFIYPFILVTSLFALWGFANDITNPMVAAFKKILLTNNFQSSLVQFAFYGGYCVMAIPAALFIKRYNYKSGILVGLTLYATGSLLFIPSGYLMEFWAFLLSYFVLTCGLSFLETTSNPYILSMGPESTATRRLNFAQAFNPLGSLTGMFVAQRVILGKLNDATEQERMNLQAANPEAFKDMQIHDIGILQGPYIAIGLIVLFFLIVFWISKLPKGKKEEGSHLHLKPTLKRLFANKQYVEGVVAQAFYVGAQIMCWTFIIQYGVYELGMTEEKAQIYNIVAMALFCTSRFICTYLLKYFSPGGLLMSLSFAALLLLGGLIFIGGMFGMFCLVGVSICMSLMFPTIYGIALDGVGDDAKLGAAGLILAIGGGSVMPPLQGAIMDISSIDAWGWVTSTRASFIMPVLSFIVISIYGFRTSKIHKKGKIK